MPDDISSDTVNTVHTFEEEERPEIIRASADILPKDTVHCFPARKSLILRRRVVAGVLGIVYLIAAVFFLLPDSGSLVLMGFASAGVIICVLVFVQSFLIESFRVALDYEKNEVVLRYLFQKIRIPFDDFDTREGKPEEAEVQLQRVFLRATKIQPKYLILDNIRESACYQTSSKDLSGQEDFDMLKREAENIRDVYRGIPEAMHEPELEEDEMARIINSALADKPKNIDE